MCDLKNVTNERKSFLTFREDTGVGDGIIGLSSVAGKGDGIEVRMIGANPSMFSALSTGMSYGELPNGRFSLL